MDTQEIDAPPDLGSLYVRALVSPLLPGGGDELPQRCLVLHDVEVDRAHLAAYDRVCGFRLSDELPVTYPHVLAFPLTMQLMTDRSFPFSLLGLVHVANRIDQRRPLDADEHPTLRVWTEDLRPHARGRQFEAVAEAEVDGEVAWTGRSTYLRPGADGSDGGSESEAGEDADGEADEDADPEEPVATWRVPGDIGRRYADVSGDRNPIHLHSLSARLFGVRGPIAHGMWMKARCLAALEGRVPASCRAQVRFTSPLRVPSEARFAARRERDGWRFALRRQGSDRPRLSGSVMPLASKQGAGA